MLRRIVTHWRVVIFVLAILLAAALLTLPIFGDSAALAYSNGGVHSNDVVRPAYTPATTGECKEYGWVTLTRPDGTIFKSQGDCIQYVITGK